MVTGAIADCERLLNGLLAQPANALSSLGFVGAAIPVWRTRHRHVGAALASTGIGSFVFHGPMTPGADWVHDVTLAWLLVAVALADSRWRRWAGWQSASAIGVALAIVPLAADGLAAMASVLAIGSVLRRDRSRRTIGALALLGLGAVVGRLSATGAPWCEPNTLLQGHAFWHLAAATAVALWATQKTTGIRTAGYLYQEA